MQSHSYCLICCPEITLCGPRNPVPSPHTALHSTPCRSHSLPLPQIAASWWRYLLRPHCCLIINLAQTASSFGSLLHAGCLLWDFFLSLLPFWIFGMTSAQIFQASSETRHGKLEWFVHAKSLWSALEQLERFCDLEEKLVCWQGKIFVFDLCIKLLNMTKLPTSEKKKTTNELLTLEEINLHLHGQMERWHFLATAFPGDKLCNPATRLVWSSCCKLHLHFNNEVIRAGYDSRCKSALYLNPIESNHRQAGWQWPLWRITQPCLFGFPEGRKGNRRYRNRQMWWNRSLCIKWTVTKIPWSMHRKEQSWCNIP